MSESKTPDWIKQYVDEAARNRMAMLEKLAAAYVLETKIPPEECELVERQDGPKIVWYFRKKGSSD